MHIGYYLSSLKSVSSTLAHFRVDMEDGPMLGVAAVLLACPNLVSLSIAHAYDADINSIPMTTWTTLTALSITFAHNRITQHQIIEIWKRFPSLKKLEVHPCSDIESALLVSEYCPTMKELRLCMEHSGIRLTYSDEGYHNQEYGITTLIIETDDLAEETCKETTSIVKRYHDTLEYLEWDMDTREDTETIDSLQFPRLTKLGLNWTEWEIVHNAPMLEELRLTSAMIGIHPQVLDMIPPHLKSLELDLDTWRLDDDHSPILCYLNRIALQSQLKEFVLRWNSRRDVASILDAIYRHDHLECLKIHFTGEWATYRMESFLDGLVKACTRLSRL